MAESLPEVSEVFTADVRPFVEAMQLCVKAAGEAAGAVEDLQKTIDLLHGKEVDVTVNVTSGLADTGALVSSLSRRMTHLVGVEKTLAAAAADTTEVMAEQAAVTGAKAAEIERLAGGVGVLALAERALRDSSADAGTAARTAAGGFRIFGVAATTLLHWVVAAGSEFLAVAIPAAVALGAAMLVAAQGAQMVQMHMSALYTATEATANMFHTTFGQALGLRSALQQAQDAANPIVWSALGGVINIVKSNFQDLAGQGLDVMRIFQTFTARVVADFQAGFGQQVHGLLAGMVTDLTMFGQILGNVGHALLSFAAAMPGLAEVLLGLFTAASHVVLWFSQLPPILITVAMAMEEVWRWGGPLAAILTRIPTLIAGFVASGFGIVPVFARVAQIFSSLLLILPRLGEALGAGLIVLGRWVPALAVAGARIGMFSEGVAAAIGGLSTLQLGLAAIAVGGLAFLVVKALTATSAIQQMADSMQHTVDTAKGMAVFGDITSNIGVLNAKLAENAAWSQRAANSASAYQAAGARSVGMQAAVAQNTGEYNAALRQQQQDLLNTAQGVEFLSRTYGVSFVGALELGTQAGVQWDQGIGKMSVAADINRIKVANLIAGYRAMGQPVGAVGADMTALAIQSGLQASKIQQLTQAWDAYVGLLTGGTNTLATFNQGLVNMGTVAASSAGKLFESQGKMNESTRQFAASLASFTGKGAQNWQNFNQVISTGAEQFINWMQTAGAVGAVTGTQMSGAIKGIVAQMIPFATHSEAARAELAGLAAQTGAVVAPTTKALEAFAKGGMNAQQMGRFVQDATAKLSDMSAVAAKLGDVMQNDLAAMFDKAKIAASGLPGALSALSNAMASSGTKSSVLSTDILNVAQKLLNLHQSLPTISAMLQTMGIDISTAGLKSLIASGQLHAAGSAAATAGGQMRTATGEASALATALSQLHSINIQVVTSFINEGSPGLGGTGFRFVPQHQAGTAHAAAGLALVGEGGPELVVFGGGEKVLTNPETRRFMSNPGGHPATSAAGGFSGNITLHHTTHVQASVDQGVLFEAMKTETAIYGTRNGVPQSGRLSPAAGSSFG